MLISYTKSKYNLHKKPYSTSLADTMAALCLHNYLRRYVFATAFFKERQETTVRTPDILQQITVDTTLVICR